MQIVVQVFDWFDFLHTFDRRVAMCRLLRLSLSNFSQNVPRLRDVY